ncbi:unnamed protein product [Auanema sp. JU1783]|nr:unnamed protein product [Auanema sp. JU1783]
MRLIATAVNGNGSQVSFQILEKLHLSSAVSHYVMISSAAILASFTILANLCTIVLLLRYRPMQKSISNLYILSLSCADVAIGLLILVLVVANLFSPSSLPTWLCDCWQIADFVLSTVSLNSICAIAFDRVWNLEKPLRVFKRSRRLARRLILLIWIAPVTIWMLYYQFLTDHSSKWTLYGMPGCTSEYEHPLLVPIVAIPTLYLPAIALVGMFIRISVVVHGHLSFLRDHSNNPLGPNSGRCSKEGTPYTRTPEPTKKFSDSSVTSGYTSMKSPRSQSPRYQRVELTPLTEEKSSGRERSQSEQLPGRIDQFDIDSSNHLRVKSTASNPTRKESIRARQMLLNQRGDNLLVPTSRMPFQRSSFRRLSVLSRTGSRRFSVIAIPSNLADLLQREGVSQQVRAAKAVALILFCFLLCWLPFLLLWPIKLYCRSCVSDNMYSIAIWLNYFCSTLNPLLYTLSSPRVRIVLSTYSSLFCLDTRRKMKQSYCNKSATFV